jgi:hypothetical protein
MLSKAGSTFGGFIAECEGIGACCWPGEELSADLRSGRDVFLNAFVVEENAEERKGFL